VLSALRTLDGSSSSSDNRAPAGQLRGVCELWLVTLQLSSPAAAGGADGQQQQQVAATLQVLGSQLLMLSKGPPAAAVAVAAAAAASSGCVSDEALLLVGEPALEEDELPAGTSVEGWDGRARDSRRGGRRALQQAQNKAVGSKSSMAPCQ
jgi:hypothetical protein